MATTTIENRPQLAPGILVALEGLRARIRRYVWLEGLTSGLTWLGVAFWASLAVDWFFEPAREVRIGVLVVAVAALLGVLVRLIGRRAFVPLTNGNMATVLERRFGRLNDSLLTAVVLTGRALEPEKCNPDMLAHTCREAAERIEGVELRQVFNPAPLRRSSSGAALFALSIVLLAGLLPETLGVWARRNLLFSDELWPRKTHLEVVGFQGGVVRVARGSDLTVIARAMTKDETTGKLLVIPQRVEVRYWTEGGRRGREPMNREGTADPDRDQFQVYSYTFQGILAPVRFHVVGGDDSVRDLQIEVVDSPTIAEMALECKFPRYMDRAPRILPVTRVMQIPLGTEATVHAKANKELVRVQIDSTRGEQAAPVEVLQAEQLGADHRSFQYTVPALTGDTTLLLTLSDTDGIKGRDPVPLTLVAVPDEPPQLSLRLDGIGAAITPVARLPLAGQITDDHGIAKVWAETAVDQNEAAQQPLAAPPQHPTNLELTDVGIEVEPLQVAAGQKLLVSAKAADLYDLGPAGPNVGSSERWVLDVVTPDQLRIMLESRELVLRQRFEVIVREVTETRDLLLKVDLNPSPAGAEEGKDSAAKTGKAADKTDNKDAAADKKTEKREGGAKGAEPGDQPAPDEAKLSPEARLAQHTLRVERALQNARKNAHETEGVAESFDDIRKQLVNNRIDTEELKIRLEDGIAKPLHHVGEAMFPDLQRELERLQQNLGDPDRAAKPLSAARKQADDILAEMQRVLDRMLQLEDFNEAVDLLRAIIKEQDSLGDQTKQRHKQEIRELKED